MYLNAKKIPVETIPGMGVQRRVIEGVNSSMIYLIHYTLTQHNNKKRKRKKNKIFKHIETKQYKFECSVGHQRK
jgi:hypothetical protein